VRAFLYACNYLTESKIGKVVTLLDLENTLKYLAADYYWPLLEELEPKLGNYAPLIEPTREITNVLFGIVGKNMSKSDYGPSCLIHKRHVERLKKAFEMLEYLGIIAKREASRKLKSGGRGPRYVLNLSILMEELSRLTVDLFSQLVVSSKYSEIFKGEELDAIKLPQPSETKELGILAKPIDILHKSQAYPYGLTYNKIDTLKGAGILTVGQLAETSDEEILNLDRISSGWLSRIKLFGYSPPGGGLNSFGKWVESREKFFIPVKVLSRKFRGKFLYYLLYAHVLIWQMSLLFTLTSDNLLFIIGLGRNLFNHSPT